MKSSREFVSKKIKEKMVKDSELLKLKQENKRLRELLNLSDELEFKPMSVYQVVLMEDHSNIVEFPEKKIKVIENFTIVPKESDVYVLDKDGNVVLDEILTKYNKGDVI